ncbi:MAG TPA: GNAT family N-acetyltransferase [Armatimonadota bacterium]|nr:GNAT family N-acetyltransferase [Armatimonadota bacterium]
MKIAEMKIDDYDEVHALWGRCEGVGLDPDDTRENIARYLDRNPGLSFIARNGEKLVGAVLCGHDGRRGYLHHLAVDHDCRRGGIGKTLVAQCIARLKATGIPKCNIFVFDENDPALAFWEADGWVGRSDLRLLQKWTSQ